LDAAGIERKVAALITEKPSGRRKPRPHLEKNMDTASAELAAARELAST